MARHDLVVMGNIILMKPSPGGARPGGDLGNIQQGSLYRASLEQAYRQAVKHTEDVPKNGNIEINRMVGGVIPNVDDGYPASMAVHLMAMFWRALIPDNSILIGTLQPDGRIGAVSLLSAKIRRLIPYSQKLFIPSGQLVTLDPIIIPHPSQGLLNLAFETYLRRSSSGLDDCLRISRDGINHTARGRSKVKKEWRCTPHF